MKTISVRFRSLVAFLLTISFLLAGFSNAPAQASVTKDAPVDFNGDGKTDFSIIRSTGFLTPYVWWNQVNGTGEVSTLQFGTRNVHQPVPADYDGDGRDDIAMFAFNGPEAGNWYIIESSTGTVRIEKFGQSGDNPTVVEDFDGDGRDDLAVFRINRPEQGPGQAYFFYRGSLNNPQGDVTYVPWGMRYGGQSESADDPYTGDFDGDGKADFAVQRHADIAAASSNTPAVFHILTAAGSVSYQYFGWKSDRVLPGDYDGDGKTDFCVARGFNISPGNTTWHIRYSSGISDESVVFGYGFNFAQGDYDGDGKTDIAYFIVGATNDETGFWYLSSANNRAGVFQRWGARPSGAAGAGDLPAAGYNNR
jgi:hypothetical protein